MVKITTYAKNVARSAKYAFVAATENNYSNIKNFKDTNSELFREAYNGMRDYKSTSRRIAAKFKESAVYEISSMAIKNTIEDLKTGDFYNKARQQAYDEKYMGDAFNIGDFELPQLGFNPDDMDNLEFTDGDKLISRTIAKTNKVSANAIASAVVQSSLNNTEVLKESTSMLYLQNLQISRQNQKAINTVSENMVTGFKDLSSLQKTMVDNSAKFYTDATNMLSNINHNIELMAAMTQPKPEQYEMQKKTTNRIQDVGEIPDLKIYMTQIKKNFTTALSDATGGLLNLDMIKGMDKAFGENTSALRNMMANPMQLVMESVVKKVIPQTLDEAMYRFDETLGNLFPAFIGRMNTLSKKDTWNGGNPLTKFIGGLLRLDTESDRKVNLKFAKTPVAWDSMSKRTLEEVIPYYLRKMTAALTGEKEMIFDGDTGKWKTMSSVRKAYMDDITNRPKYAFSEFTSELKKAMKNVYFSDADDKRAFDKDYEKFKDYIFKAGDIDLKGKTGTEIGLSNDMSLEIIKKAMETMNPAVVMGLVSKIQSNKNYISRLYKNIDKNSAYYKLLTEGILPSDNYSDREYATNPKKNKIDTHLDDGPKKGIDISRLTDKYGKTVYDYLNIINKNLEFMKNEGVITYNQTGGTGTAGSGFGTAFSTQPSLPTGYRTRAEATNGVFKRTETPKDKTRRIEESEDRRYEERVESARRHANNKVFVDMYDESRIDDIAANMARTYEADFEEERRIMNRRRDASKKTLIQDLFNLPSDQEYADKFKELTNMRDKWAVSKTLGDKVFLVKDKLRSWVDAPSAMLEKAILAADRHIFDLFYRTSTEEMDDDGKPIAGFMDLMKYKLGKTFVDVKDTLADLFGKAKDKFKDTRIGKWLGNLKDEILHGETSPIKHFTDALKDQFSGITQSYKDAFTRAAEALGVPEYRAELKAKREGRAQENEVRELSVDDIANALHFRNANASIIQQLVSDNQFSHDIKSQTLTGKDKALYDSAFKRGKRSEAAFKQYEELKRIISDPNATQLAKDVATERLKDIDARLQEVDGFDWDAAIRDNQTNIRKAKDTIKTNTAAIKTQENIIHGLDENGNPITYATEEKRQQATTEAYEKRNQLQAELDKANADIEKYREEAKRLGDRKKAVVEEMNEASDLSALMSKIVDNPFKQLFDHTEKQRQMYRDELDKAQQDFMYFKTVYESLNQQATELYEKLTDDSQIANMTPDELLQMTEEQSNLTNKANDARAKMKEAANRRRTAQSNFDDQPKVKAQAIKEVMDKIRVDSMIVEAMQQDRKRKANEYRRRLNDNSTYKTDAVKQDLENKFKAYSRDMESEEYINSLDSKGQDFMNTYLRNMKIVEDFIADPAIDDETKAALTEAFNNRTVFNDVDEYESMKEKARLKRSDIFGLRTMWHGGYANHDIDSIVSDGEVLVHPNGRSEVINSGRGASIRHIAKGSALFNFKNEAGVRADARRERAFKNSLKSNAAANNGMSKLSPQRIASAFRDNIGYEGLAKGTIGAGAGLLLGSPLLGFGAGIGSTIIKNNQAVNEALFGKILDYDENGNPIKRDASGLIKPYIADTMPDMKTGGLLGSVLGLVTPFGPVGGAIIGSGLGFFKNTKYAQDVLFGEGQLLSPDNRDKIKKALPNIGIGAAAGALFGPFGLVGGALLGGGAGLLTTTEKFKDAMFGELDEQGKRHGGIVGALKDNLVEPFKTFGTELLDHVKETMKEDFFEPVKDAILGPIQQELKDLGTGLFDFFKTKAEDLIIKPAAAMVRDLLSPIRKLTMGILKGATNVLMSPFKLVGKAVGGVGNVLRDKQIRQGRANYMTAAERNARRQKKGGLNGLLKRDRYEEFDKNLEMISNTSSAEDLTTFRNALKFNLEGEQGLNSQLRQNSAAIDKKIADKFKVLFGGNGNAIMKAIKANKYEKAFDLIRTTRAVNGERLPVGEANALISEVQELLKQRDVILSKKDTYKMTDTQIAKQAEKMGIKNWDKKSKKEKTRLMNALQSEITAKEAANIKYGTADEAAKIAEGLKNQTLEQNNEAVTNATNALKDLVFAITNLNEMLQYGAPTDQNNSENIASNQMENIRQGISNGTMTPREGAFARRTVENTLEYYNNRIATAETRRANAGAAVDDAYAREIENYNEKFIKPLHKLSPLYASYINETNTPNICDIRFRDRARMVLDLGKKGWLFDETSIKFFDELSDEETDKVWNVFTFNWSRGRKFFITKEVIETILALKKNECAKLGDFLNENNVNILKKYTGYSAELKDFLKTIDKKVRYNRYGRTHSFSESNNPIKRNIGRAANSVFGEQASEIGGTVMREVSDRFNDVNNARRSVGNAIRETVTPSGRYARRRNQTLTDMSQAGMFDEDAYLSPKALRSLTKDQLQMIYEDYLSRMDIDDDEDLPTNAMADDRLDPVNADMLLSMALAKSSHGNAAEEMETAEFRLAKMIREASEGGGIQDARLRANERKTNDKKSFLSGLAGLRDAKKSASRKKMTNKKKGLIALLLNLIHSNAEADDGLEPVNADMLLSMALARSSHGNAEEEMDTPEFRLAKMIREATESGGISEAKRRAKATKDDDKESLIERITNLKNAKKAASKKKASNKKKGLIGRLLGLIRSNAEADDGLEPLNAARALEIARAFGSSERAEEEQNSPMFRAAKLFRTATEEAGGIKSARAEADARKKAFKMGQESGLEKAKEIAEATKAKEKAKVKGSKEETEKQAEEKSFKDSVITIKDKLTGIFDKFSAKKDDLLEKKDSLLSRIMSAVGKAWFGIKLVGGVPLAIGFASKYVVPFVKDKFVPWLVGKKNANGQYEGGLASGIANSFGSVMTDKVLPAIKSGLSTAGGFLSDVWSTGKDVIINDIMPAAVDLIVDKLPEIIEGAVEAAWLVIKEGAKAVATKLGFGGSGSAKADSKITSEVRRSTGTTGNEINESQISRDVYKEKTKGKGTVAVIAQTAVSGPTADSEYHKRVVSANADLYNQYKNSGTEYLNENYADVIANNQQFQSVRDKEVQDLGVTSYGKKSILQVAGRNFTQGAAGINAGTKAAKGASAVLKGLGRTPVVGKIFKVADKGVQGIAAAGNAGNKIYMAANPQIAAKAAAKAAKQKAKGSLFGRLVGNGEKEATKLMAEASSKAATKAATEIAEEAVEKGMLATVEESAKLAAGSGEKTGLLAKITGGLKNLLTKFFEDSRVIKKLGPLAKKVGTPIEKLVTKCKGAVGKLTEGLAAKLGFASTEALSKAASKVCAIITLAQMVIDFLTGMDDARNILGVVDDDMGAFDRFLAGVCKMLSGLLCYLLSPETILDIFIKVYDFLGIYYGKELKKRQEEAKEAIDLYNAEHGTDFETVKDFNDAIHPTVAAKVKNWIGDKAESAKKGAKKLLKGAKDKLSDAGSAVKNFFTGGKKKTKDSAKEIAENAMANQGLDKIDNEDFASAIDSALNDNLPIGALAEASSKLHMNAEADDALTPILEKTDVGNKLKSLGKKAKDKLAEINPLNKIKDQIMNPLRTFVEQFYGDNSIEASLTKFANMNKSVNDQIENGKIKTTQKKYWDISTGGDTGFAASLYKLSEFMRRAINSPLAIIQDAINSAFETEVGSVTEEVSGTGTGTTAKLAGSTDNNTGYRSALNPSTTGSTSKPKGKLASLVSGIFKKVSGKGAIKDTRFHNLKFKYAIDPKPFSNDTASFIRSQYAGESGKGLGEDGHIYQRDFNDRFNISGDSNFQSIADSGCGPVVASTVLQQKGMKYDVKDAAKAALKFKEKDGGTYPEYFGNYLGQKGIKTSNINTRSDLRRRLRSGESVILMGQSGKGRTTPFGKTNAHYVLATGMRNNDIIIQDPEDRRGNAIYNANDVINDSIYAIGTGKGKSGRPSALKYGKFGRSGLGTLTATEENNWYKVLHELIIMGEVGSSVDYSCVVGDDEGAMSMGVIGFHAGNAQRVLNAIADRIPDSDDAAYVRSVANKATGTISDAEATKLSEVLKKYNDISKDVQDQDAYNLYKTTQSYQDALSDYTQTGYLKDPRSSLVAADMYNIGWHNGWKDGWSPSKSGDGEIEEVANRISTAGWFANSGYADAYARRARQAAEALKKVNLASYTSGTILGSDFTAKDPGDTTGTNGSSSSSTDNTFIGKLAAYIKKAMKTMYGGVYEALFGSIDTVNASASTSSGTTGSYEGSEVTANGADAWFLQTLKGSSITGTYGEPRSEGPHSGIDYAAPSGTEIYSPVDGAVVFSGWNTGGYGNLVIVQDTHGYYHIFGHQCETPPVKLGQEVTRGTLIGKVGSTGYSTGPHLHYQVNRPTDMWHADVDPNKYDYSDYIKSSSSSSSTFVTTADRAHNSGKGLEMTDPESMVKQAIKTAKGYETARKLAANLKSASGAAPVPGAKNVYSGKCGTPTKSAMGVKKFTDEDVTNAIGVLRNEAAKASGHEVVNHVNRRMKTGASDGTNRQNIGGPSSNTDKLLVAIANILANIAGNTEKLNEVVALVSKLTVSNAVQLQGSSNSGKTSKSGSGVDSDVMADLSKILMTATASSSARGLSALNTSFQNMNNSQIIDAIYQIAKQ